MTPAVVLVLGIAMGTALGFVLGGWGIRAMWNRGYMVGWRAAAEHFPKEQDYGYEMGYQAALQAEKVRANGVPR